MVTPFWMKSGLSAAMVGMVSGVGGAFITMAGAMAGGELCTRLGLYRALFLVGAAQALSNLGYAAAAISPSNLSIVSASAVDSFCSGLGTAGFLAAMMRITGREQATTRLAALTALTMLTRTTAGLFSGVLADRVGFSGWFALTFVLSIPGLLLLPALKPRLR
jgi:MFS transporter, PAT family, beta-lactamase induction signal transducer AmpG